MDLHVRAFERWPEETEVLNLPPFLVLNVLARKRWAGDVNTGFETDKL